VAELETSCTNAKASELDRPQALRRRLGMIFPKQRSSLAWSTRHDEVHGRLRGVHAL